MIRLSEQAIGMAFEAFCSRRRQWVEGLELQMRMYAAAASAFDGDGGLAEFRRVYEGLRKWKLFRAGRVEAVEWVFEKLNSCDMGLRQCRLSGLDGHDWPKVWSAIKCLRGVKPNMTGPSLMAISKFLHFWNPRVFVICDQQEVEQFVFGHRWLEGQLGDTGEVLDAAGVSVRQNPRLCRYLQVLGFASQFVKANPGILPAFVGTVRAIARGAAVPVDIETYEATAAEWCLVGLAEMPPSGVEVVGART